MSEEHQIIGLARGEPLPEGRIGVCLRFPLSGSPSQRWSRDLRARLGAELTGRSAVGHLRLNELVQGQEIVLEGVEPDEASDITGAVERAVDAANNACADSKGVDQSENDRRTKADAVARNARASQRRLDLDRPDGNEEA